MTKPDLLDSAAHKKYIRKFIWITAIPLFTVTGFNLVVDPYDIFNSPAIGRFNLAKTEKWKNDRLYKAIDVIREKPTIIFLGSSRTHIGLNPNFVRDTTTNKPAYNLALLGASPYELERYLEHTISNQSELKKVFIGLDFFMFYSASKYRSTYREDRIGKSYLSISDTHASLLSIQSFIDSWNTVYQNYQSSQKMHSRYAHGFQYPIESELFSEETFSHWAKFQIQNKKSTIRPERVEEFDRILALAKENDIEIYAFISPIHATHLEAIYQSESWDEFEKWKRLMVEKMPLWDFSGYHEFTSEPVTPEIQNFIDSSHYHPRLGAKLLDRILQDDMSENERGTIEQSFGVWVTTENIDQHLENIRSARQAWLKTAQSEVVHITDLD